MEPEEIEESGHFDVWAENWTSLTAWLACETQWRMLTGQGGLIWIGLDYAGVDVVLKRRKTPDETFDHLQLMEAEALTAFGEGAR